MLILVDLDDTLAQYTKAYDLGISQGKKYPQAEEGFFLGLETMPNMWVVKELALEHDVWIATAPSVRNPLSYMEKRIWVEAHLGMDFARKLIIIPNKGLLRGDILIDDKTSGFGQENFKGKLIQFGSEQFPNWPTIRDYINRIKL